MTEQVTFQCEDDHGVGFVKVQQPYGSWIFIVLPH